MNAFDDSPLTTIAAVHGVTFGGGFELALACDLIVADKMARFCFPELRLGLIPGFGGIPRLKRDLGNALVRDLILTGRSINATKAQAVGLVSQITGEGEALRVARATAEQLRNLTGKLPAPQNGSSNRFHTRNCEKKLIFSANSSCARPWKQVCANSSKAPTHFRIFPVVRLRERRMTSENFERNYGKISSYEALQQTTDEVLRLAAAHFRVPQEQLRADDDFFKKLGINSLQALDLLTRLEQHFHIELPITNCRRERLSDSC